MRTTSSRTWVFMSACTFGFLATAVYSATPIAHAATTATSTVLHCTIPMPCADVTNRGSGIAINGIAANDSGIEGATYSPNGPITMHGGLQFGLTGGVVGKDLSSAPLTSANSGVVGLSLTGSGIFGVMYNSFNYGAGTDITTLGVIPAVFGLDAGPDNGFTGSGNAGIGGQSLSRVGGIFLSRTGYGAVGRTFTGTGVLGVSRAAGGVALAARSLRGGPVFRGFNATREVASLDSNGNFIIAGTIRTGDVPEFATTSANGSSVVTYGARQSMAMVEDFGQVQMRSGSAEVRLDPTFAQLMDPNTTYMVFITAEGDNRGVYVTNKTHASFSVRESGGGRSTLALSYRIVAHAFGAHDSRFSVAPSPATVPTEALAPNHRGLPLLRE